MNIRPYIILNGVDSRSLEGLLITSLPPITKPLQRTLIETIDGRDGDSAVKLGFSAYDKPLGIALTRNFDIDKIIEYFNSEGSVIFSNEPDKVYQYAIYEAIDFERLIRFKTGTVTLHVQPFKKAVDEIPLSLAISSNPASINIYNAGNVEARPVIKLTAIGIVTLTLNLSEVLIIDFGDSSQTIFIDTEKLDAYNAQGELLNRLCTGNYDNIILNKGNNILTVTGTATAIEITNYTRYI